MHKIILISMAMFLFISGPLLYSQASSVIDLEGLENPQYMIAKGNILLIEDNSRIKMYGLKDFKLITTIGRKGEGPAEFKGSAIPQILSDSIMVSSYRKVSFFDFSGKFIKENRFTTRAYNVKKVKTKYIGHITKVEPDDFYLLYNIYGSDFTIEKTIHRGKWLAHRDKTRDLFEIFFLDVYDGKIIFAHRQGFGIEILDEQGKNLHTIKADLPRMPFSQKQMDRLFKRMELNSKNKESIRQLKKRTVKPDYYPPIRTCRVADGKIYVVTYLKEKGRSQCLVYNMEGKQLRKIFIPLKDASPLSPPPFTISNGRLYQLVENEEKEQWQLIIDKL